MQDLSKWTDEYIRHTNRKGLALLALRANATAAIDERNARIAELEKQVAELREMLAARGEAMGLGQP